MRSMVTVVHKGGFKNTDKYLDKLRQHRFLKQLNKYGQMGVEALRAATPVRTGTTAASWEYRIIESGDTVTLSWYNTNETRDGDNIVIMLVRGHGTKNGSYVRGNDFVTPTLKPLFDEILAKLSEEVTP